MNITSISSTPIDDYVKEMFITISKVCDLPNSETKNRLLFGLSHAVVGLCAPPMIVYDGTKIFEDFK